MKPFEKNPRKISEQQKKMLSESLNKLGDISGIVHDIETDEIISGNQRISLIDLKNSKIDLVKKFNEPDEFGTIAYGYIHTSGGLTLNYRQVIWDEELRDIANVAANKIGGEWDFEILNSELWDKDILVQAGFDYLDFNQTPVNTNIDSSNKRSAGKTRTTKLFKLEVLFEDKLDYLICVEILDKSKKDNEKTSDVLKRLLSEKIV